MTNAPTEAGKLVIERADRRVILVLNLTTEYEAIEVYDTLIHQAREGFVLLDVETVAK